MSTETTHAHLRVVGAAEALEKRIAAAVRAEMAARRVTQKALAYDVFASYQQKIGRRYSGDVAWSAGELAMIADYLGVPVERFYSDQWSDPFDDTGPASEPVRRQGLEPRTRWLKAA